MFQRTEVIKFRDFMKKNPKDSLDFFLEEMLEEVKSLNFKDPKKVKQFISTTSLTLGSLLATTIPAGAEGIGLPKDVDDIFVKIQLACVGLSGGLAILCLMAAGVCRMLKLENIYKGWTKEIYKGLLQIMTAPVAIAVFILIIQMVLKLFPGHLPS